MGVEIERKFLLQQDGISDLTKEGMDAIPNIELFKDKILRTGKKIRQGYMPINIGKEIIEIIDEEIDFIPGEARLREYGNDYIITVKGQGMLSRNESEFKISKTIFDLYWPYAKRRIEKVRGIEEIANELYEVDVFTDRDLILAEKEFASENLATKIPEISRDVTEHPQYKNKGLAKTNFHRKFIVTGGPCTGKTTVLNYLQDLQYPVIEESARSIIEHELNRGGDILPWKKFSEFQLAILKKSLESERQFEEQGTVFLDRGIPDAVAYCVLAGKELPTPLNDAVRNQDYAGVFVLDPLPYVKDDARQESVEEAMALQDKLIQVYKDLGESPISVPTFSHLNFEDSVRSRAHYIINNSYKKV